MDFLDPFENIGLTAPQRAWIQQERARHPIQQHQRPEDWLVWRTKVAEGMEEAAAWADVMMMSSDPTMLGVHNHPIEAADSVNEYTMDMSSQFPQATQHNFSYPSGSTSNHQPTPSFQQFPQDWVNNGNVSYSQQQYYNHDSWDHGASASDVPMGMAMGMGSTINPMALNQMPLHQPYNLAPGSSIHPSHLGAPTAVSNQHDGAAPEDVDLDDADLDELDELEDDVKPVIPQDADRKPSLQLNGGADPSSRAKVRGRARDVLHFDRFARSPSLAAMPATAPEDLRDSSPLLVLPPGRRDPHPPPLVSPFNPNTTADAKRAAPEDTPVLKTEPTTSGRTLKRARLNSSSIDPPEPSASTSTSLAGSGPGAGKPIKGLPGSSSKMATEPPSMSTIRPLLRPEVLKLEKPAALFKFLRGQDDGKPPLYVPSPQELKEILFALLRHAPELYLKRMAEKELYVLCFVTWIKNFKKEPERWKDIIPPLLNILARTHMTFQMVLDTKMGFQAKAAARKASDAELDNKEEIAKALQRYESWVTSRIIPTEKNDGVGKLSLINIDSKVKVETALSGKIPTKPDVSGSGANTSSTAKPAATSSMSIFNPTPGSGTSSASASASAYRPRVRAPLPDIKKGSSNITSGSGIAGNATPSGSGPSQGLSLLSSVLQKFEVVKPESPVFPGPASAGGVESKVKLNKKGFTVKFKDEALEAVRLFTAPDFEAFLPPWREEEESDGNVVGRSSHDLDIDEGAALRRHSEHEPAVLVEWYQPEEYSQPANSAVDPANFSEARVQADRERGVMVKNYDRDTDIPPNPDELRVRVVDEGPETFRFRPPDAPVAPAPLSGFGVPGVPVPTADISSLLKNLQPVMANVLAPPPGQPQAYPVAYAGQDNRYAYNTNANANANMGYNQPPAQAPQWGQGYAQGSNSYPPANNPYERQPAAPYGGQRQPDPYPVPRGGARPWERGGHSGAGGARRGARTVVCKHWLQNDCRKGDQCNFKHAYD